MLAGRSGGAERDLIAQSLESLDCGARHRRLPALIVVVGPQFTILDAVAQDEVGRLEDMPPDRRRRALAPSSSGQPSKQSPQVGSLAAPGGLAGLDQRSA